MSKKTKLPIIYSPAYNITLFGLQSLHPFDSEKYQKVYNYLRKNTGIAKSSFVKPKTFKWSNLQEVHSREYIKSLSKTQTIVDIAELSFLKYFPAFILKQKILQPMLLATGGTVLGAKLAMENGWAINLSGGYHHAKADSSSGFCFFADIPLAIYELRKKQADTKVLIIDLDAHQGNGYQSILAKDKNTFMLDVYNEYNFPYDEKVKKFIHFNIPIPPKYSSKKYQGTIQKEITYAIKKTKPDLIIYVAGTDVLHSDPLGKLSLSEKEIIKRDESVFRMARETLADKQVPILMLLAGGYTNISGRIIGESIENILKNVLHVEI